MFSKNRNEDQSKKEFMSVDKVIVMSSLEADWGFYKLLVQMASFIVHHYPLIGEGDMSALVCEVILRQQV